ncbi:MAG TPA: polyhydroxyalkanoic acid system family protein [Isosphaeraceae bacterium]|jgi:hypothetical protein
MPQINLAVKHDTTLEEARVRLETAVQQVSSQFRAFIWKVEWAPDRSRVRMEGAGFWVEMWVDDREVHATGDVPALGGLLGSPLASGLKQIVQRTFQKRLT